MISPRLPVLRAENIALVRGRRQILSHFSCALYEAEALWLRAPNGGGKSSLMMALIGLLPLESGNILWHGVSLPESRENISGQVYYIGHHLGLKAAFTVIENIRIELGLALAPMPSEQLLLQSAAEWGLADLLHRKVGQLSQGQKRRAALLILSLLPYRPVWLLDEPFEALDDSAQALLAGKINTQISHGGTVLLTSHFSLPESLTVTRQIDLADL